MSEIDAQPLTAMERTLLNAARIVDAYGDKPVPWVQRATLHMAAHHLAVERGNELQRVFGTTNKEEQ